MIELTIRKTLSSPSGEMLLHIQGTIARGSLVTLYGKSGAGKTTLLRLLAGLLSPDTGRIVVDNVTWLDTQQGINLRPQQRSTGLVFQDYALFPHMSVLDNLRFALTKGQDPKVVGELLEIVDLGALQHQKPATLSGGQQQRVALARALVQRPRLLMLDEPLSALDHEMRSTLQQYILQLHRTYGLTTLLVSHDTNEIRHLSDRVLVIDQGQLVRQGTPDEVFSPKPVGEKFQLVGEVVAITPRDDAFIVTVRIGQNRVQVVVDADEVVTLPLGTPVWVSSEAWQPVIRKLE